MAEKSTASGEAVPIYFVTGENWPQIRADLPAPAARFASASHFEPLPGRSLVWPAEDGRLGGVLFGL